MPKKLPELSIAQTEMLIELTNTTDLTWKEKAEHISRMSPGEGRIQKAYGWWK